MATVVVGLVELALLGSASTAIAAICLQNQAASPMNGDGKVRQGAASSLTGGGTDSFVSQGSSVVVSALCSVPAWRRAGWPVSHSLSLSCEIGGVSEIDAYTSMLSRPTVIIFA